MRAPSVKKLTEAFRDLDRKDANLIRKFAKAVDDPEKLEELVEKVPATEAYVRSLYSDPYRSGIWRITVAMHAISELVGGYGDVQGLGPGRSGDYAPPYEYVNMGDPYVTTLIYDRDKDELFIGNWGAIVEEEGDDWEENPSRDPQEVWDYLSADEQRALKRDAKAKWSPHQDRFVSLGIIQVEVPKTSSDPWVATGFFGSPPDYPKVTLTPLGERVRTVGKRKSNPGPSAGATASDLVRKLKF